MSAGAELRLRCPADARSVAPVRHALRAFMEALGFDGRSLDDVSTAAGEALANIVEHSYSEPWDASQHDLQLLARIERGNLCVEVSDSGAFIVREPLMGRGFGLRIVEAIASVTHVDTANGTLVRMTFPGPIQES